MIDVRNAYDGRGLLVYLCNPLDREAVRARCAEMCKTLAEVLAGDAVALGGERAMESLVANTRKLVALLEQFLIYDREARLYG